MSPLLKFMRLVILLTVSMEISEEPFMVHLLGIQWDQRELHNAVLIAYLLIAEHVPCLQLQD